AELLGAEAGAGAGARELVRAVLADVASAPISEAHKALYHLIEQVNRDSASIGQAHIDAARAHGWSDEALYDAFTVCALFNFYNVWIDATGVQDMPPEAYEASGKRMAARGYV